MKEITSITEVVNLLKQGAVGIFPCDTIWGLIGLTTEENCKKLLAIKQRQKSPFLMLMPTIKMALEYCDTLNSEQTNLIKEVWPGPTTLILPKHPQVSSSLTLGKNTVALRVPQWPLLTQLFEELPSPIFSTSVNVSGEPALQQLDELKPELAKSIDFVFLNPNTGSGKASTLIDTTQTPFKWVRP